MRLRIHPRICVLLILLAAFALWLYRLGIASLWYDETVSTFLAQQDLIALTRHTAGDIHPPLYYYLLHFWGRLAGWSEFSAAFLSLFFGVLLIALIYRVAREWFTPAPSPVQRGRGEGVGVLAAFLVAISPYNLWYSQEVRMYTLGATLGLASVYFFVRVLSQQSPRFTFYVSRDFIAYAVVSALGLYTLYYFAFLLVFENLVALIWLVRNLQFTIASAKSTILNLKSEIGIWILSQLAILLLYAPWVPSPSAKPPIHPCHRGARLRRCRTSCSNRSPRSRWDSRWIGRRCRQCRSC